MLAFHRLSFLAALALSFVTAGCSTAYVPSRAASFEIDSAKQIDDDDIRKAFEARPQLPAELRVAYYTFDPEIANDLDAALAKLPGVVSVYRIPPLMVTGQRRFESSNPWAQPKEVTVKKLRLFAARARADVLIVVDHGFKGGGANGLAAFNFLILPILFMPFLDNTTEGYAEAYLIDVRNGYLYGHITQEDKRGKDFVQIYDKSPATLGKEQWTTLREAMLKDLTRVVADERSKKVAAPHAAPAPAPAPVAAPPPAVPAR